jgi:oligopeptide/dipeptide ABC transporter ATP-binding protein
VSLLEIEKLTVDFRTLSGTAPAVRGVDLRVEAGETVGLVGESGCGKSQTCLAIPRLIHPSGTIRAQRMHFEGEDLLAGGERGARRLRGSKIGVVFQEPMSSLNPCMAIGEQLAEPLVLHRGLAWRAAYLRVGEMLAHVGIPEPERRLREYPHQLSGGMRQRAMIAMAMICQPRLLIADEPTTALDVTVQAQILALIRRLRDATGAAVLLVTHNFGVIAQSCDRVSVMYAGVILESGSTEQLLSRPTHSYTRALLQAVPRLRDPLGSGRPLRAVPGAVPSIWEMPDGCAFHPRCESAQQICADELPEMVTVEPGHEVRCHRASPTEGEGRSDG